MLLSRIKNLCSFHNITIAQLEKKLNFANGTVHKWSKSQPSAQKVLKVAQYFDVSLEYLFDKEEILSKESMCMAKQFEKLPQKQKSLIMETMFNSKISY
ncbi:MAG: helix-turn-helix transcriptional regulator [Lachnospiraceae bacterium]|nr:helix-turn-helix transcriptional regulator [Lachnospiraceae bacterium]